ncbi:hypothetical protein BBK82_00270 [Lentzea guizhouensis]|uniref:Uncharacterized protein n=1 Tax=Lentzea guizhouensis TaxID=1586287 RepID=A0A1B2HAK4_9PSEU|nr:hypothetical protein [Lentzea guizhouensis]ANZ34745.1 hypothetical protein BBK82_00270 [Lentzea guizhouensis]
MTSRVVAVVAAVLAVATGLADRFAEPVAVPFGQEPGWLLTVLDTMRVNTPYELYAVVIIAVLVAVWRRDVVVLVASAGLLVYLWWDRPTGQGMAYLSQEEFAEVRGSLGTNGFIAGGVLLAAAASSAIYQFARGGRRSTGS